jgi:hypothetical protein
MSERYQLLPLFALSKLPPEHGKGKLIKKKHLQGVPIAMFEYQGVNFILWMNSLNFTMEDINSIQIDVSNSHQ